MGSSNWLPIQQPFPERLAEEVRDDVITIYLSWIGIKYEGDRPELLAIVNEFTVAPKQAAIPHLGF